MVVTLRKHTPRSRSINPLATPGFMCPSCKERHTSVVDSRPRESGYIRRRRVCDSCTFKFSTIEVPLDFFESADLGSLRTATSNAMNELVRAFNALNRGLKRSAKVRDEL